MEQKIIENKLDLPWYFISVYLDMLSKMGTLRRDKVFDKKLKDLQDYVNSKITLKSDGDVLDFFVTVLQKPED